MKSIREHEVLQQQWRKERKLGKAEVDRYYRLLEWCDALSLLLSQQENQPKGRNIEIRKAPDKRSYHLRQCGPGKLNVKPWSFELERFEVFFELGC